uniref:Uncharacterized protein n=1 Tax=Pristionchus pacificus TaxID=54126 RepID=A0A2A6BCF1_PRIPA|eukprot:PDM63570.1 hypothetical protein PRIPAC_49543 [Pristionchus pacificus]
MGVEGANDGGVGAVGEEGVLADPELKIEKTEEREMRARRAVEQSRAQPDLRGAQAGAEDLNPGFEDLHDGHHRSPRSTLRIATLDRPSTTRASWISTKDTEDLKPGFEDLHDGQYGSPRSTLRIATLGRPSTTRAPRISTKDTEDLKPNLVGTALFWHLTPAL